MQFAPPCSRSLRVAAQRYVLGAEIGDGRGSVVYSAKHAGTNADVAIKVSRDDEDSVYSLKHEQEVLERVPAHFAILLLLERGGEMHASAGVATKGAGATGDSGMQPRSSDGSPPRSANGSQPRSANGSPPRAANGSQPRSANGSQPRAANGSPPRSADGSPPRSAEPPAFSVLERMSARIDSYARSCNKAGDPLREHDIARIMGHVLSGLAHLHAHGVMHADLKPANVLVRFATPTPAVVPSQSSAGAGAGTGSAPTSAPIPSPSGSGSGSGHATAEASTAPSASSATWHTGAGAAPGAGLGAGLGATPGAGLGAGLGATPGAAPGAGAGAGAGANGRLTLSDIKVADFGLARPAVAAFPRTLVQSPWYRAPEVQLGQVYGAAADLWSAGALMFELTVGRPLFAFEPEEDPLHALVQEFGYYWIPSNHKRCREMHGSYYYPERDSRLVRAGASLAARRLVNRLLEPYAASRVSALEALRDPYFDPLAATAAAPTSGPPLRATV